MIFKDTQKHPSQTAELVLNPASGEVWLKGKAISLPKLSFKLLLVLAENAPATLSQDALIELIWKDNVVGDETLKQRVKLLRKALGDNAQSPKYIGIVRGRGYYLIPTVKILMPPPRAKINYEFALNERVPDLSSVEGMRIWRKMSFVLMFSILLLILVLYALSRQLNEKPNPYDRSHLAILPFVNITQDRENDYLLKGISRELIEMMSKLEAISVVSIKNITRYNNSQRQLSEIAKTLNVGTILDSRLTRDNNQLIFHFKLFDSNTAKLLWQAKYNFNANDLLTMQRQIITQVSTHLKANILPRTKINNLALTQPVNKKQAHDIYLRGLDYYYRYHADDNKIAIRLFKQALQINPHFGAAYAGLADAYSQGVYQFGGNDQWRELAFQSALKAVEINPLDEAAHKAKAITQYLKGHLLAAISSNLKAVKLNPQYIQATTNLAFLYRESGQLNEALRWNLRTLEIDSNYAPGYLHLAQTYSAKNKIEQAENHFRRALELKPDYSLAKKYYAVFLATHTNLKQALNTLELTKAGSKSNYSLFITAGDISLLSGENKLAENYYQKAAKFSDVNNNIRLRLKLSICHYLDNKNNPLLNKLLALKQRLNSEQSNNPQDFILMSIAYRALGNNTKSNFLLEQAKNYGFIDEKYIQRHPLLSPL